MEDVRDTPRPLGRLLRCVREVEADDALEDVVVSGIAASSGEVRPGDVFVAVPGSRADGHAFVKEAVDRGARAVIVEHAVEEPGVPVVQVPDTRAALATLAAEWHGRPADELCMVGITGSLGKTSTLVMLEAILAEAGRPAGVVGSLGARFRGRKRKTRLTTPDPLTLHGALRWMRDGGAVVAAMEATSHALVQRRISGLVFDLGVFTNLVLLEHAEYHGSFRNYVEAKTRFFDHLRSGAPLVHAGGDRLVRRLAEEHDVVGVSCGAGTDAVVRDEDRALDPRGTRLRLRVRQPVPRVGGGRVEPMHFPLELRLLGRSNVTNATLAATAALCLGVPVPAIQQALAAFPPPRRRMQLLHRGRFTVLDDTVGHPDSVSAVFEMAGRLEHRRLHVAYAIRGQRGGEINRRDAEALAIWSRNVGLDRLFVTSSAEAADPANRVEAEERDAFLATLRRYRIPYKYRERLEATVREVLDGVGPGDLVLLLGAQGMDRGAAVVGEWLQRNGEAVD